MATTFGPYQLLALLGRGGMGEVWRALDTRADREVALKVLGTWLHGEDEFSARFRRESSLAARFYHPNVVPIHGIGEIDGRLYFDMALIDGTSLATLVDRGPLPPERAVGIVTQVAKALDAAHRRGMVHRDVKPSNILVTDNGGDDHAYLIDFGIAHALDDTRLTRSHSIIGTPAYMAPERFAGGGDHRGDLYALGCVLSEALTGLHPFPATNVLIAMNAHQNLPPPRPSASRPDLPPALDAVVAKALAKAPADRFATGAALATAARAALADPFATVTQQISAGDATDVHTIASASAQTSGNGRPLTAVVPNRSTSGPSGGEAPRRRPARLGGVRPALVALAALAVLATAVVAVVAWTRTPAANPTATAPVAISAAPTSSFAGPIVERTLTGHSDTVEAVTTGSIDGRPVIVSGGDDHTVRVWDLATGGPIGVPLTGHTNTVSSVTIAELKGRPVIVSGSVDDTIRVWDLKTGAPVGSPLTGHTDAIAAVTTAQLDGRTVIVSGSSDRTIRVWDLATGAPVGSPLTGHTDSIATVATAQLDGRTVIVSGSNDRTIRVWDLATGAPVLAPLTGHTDSVYSVTTAELDGRPVIVSGSVDHTVRVWDLRTGAPIGKPLVGHTDAVYSVVTTQLNGRPVIVSGGKDRTLRVWNLADGAPIGSPITGHTDNVFALTATQGDGQPIIVSGSTDHSVRIWDLTKHPGIS